MLIKLSVIWFLLNISVAQEINHQWDLAVAVNNQIELLDSNGSLVGSAIQKFSKLKALTYDIVRHQFLVSDMDQKNDTIYSVQLTKETDTNPILQDLPDDVQGLAVDPVSDILYWTDAVNRTINKISLKDPLHIYQQFLEFKVENPQDIAIDLCRRYVYWTNSNVMKPTIERATLDGNNHEVLVSDDLFMPSGITIDQSNQRLYWADMREGIYFRIESMKFDGGDRRVLYEGTHQKPFGVGVDDDYVYWTDVNSNALWRISKNFDDTPKQLKLFNDKPMGIVVKRFDFSNISECHNVVETINNYNDSEHVASRYNQAFSETDKNLCLNSGVLYENGCKCRKGFTGSKCETSLCYNFCVHGSCHLTSTGYPQCRCPVGYVGSRCERNICDGFCLNGGKCYQSPNATLTPACECSESYKGSRCERSTEAGELCSLFCQGRQTDILVDQKNTFVCRCQDGQYTIIENTENLTAYELVATDDRHPLLIEHFRDPAFIILSSCMLVMFILLIGLAACVCRLRRRPRIKKRIIVNKNVTPLTYRPQPPTEQCEITIENCCNMNVCETPCFEPPTLRNFQNSKKDEKKTLLSNMENGDDLY